MWSAQIVLLLSVVFIGRGTLALSLEQAETDSAADEPDLLHMLDFFKGKSDISEMTSLLKKYKVLEAFGKKGLDLCAPCKQYVMAAAKTNVGIRILYKTIEGQAPDIKDLYELATKGAGNMAHDIDAARKKQKNIDQFSEMLFGNKTLSSAPLTEKLVDYFTGKPITIDPALLKQVNAGHVLLTQENIAQANLLLFIASIKENTGVMTQLQGSFAHRPLDFYYILETLQRLNTSTFSKIKVIAGAYNDSKYVVAGGQQAFVTHPGVVKILNDRLKIQQLLKEKSQDKAKAETLLIAFLSDLMNLMYQVFNDAEKPRSSSSV